ncbi:MAG: L-fucose mutarotase [Sphingomonas sanxanigenens]|uniref:L-fucose mutarotase n=1 Tax=Sphingomonas sanxanigenens TaxID=397260 RepID=A0A2W5ABJ2_9SPHN|nr:MAG: L-fucose mutarotase [Sphingomonas sanxanigenens]
MRRIVRALDLRNDADLIAEYRARHRPGAVWIEVLDHIRAQGVHTMEIWQVADRLVMIADVSDDFPRAIEEPARITEWERLMDRFQKRLPGSASDEKWIEMERIFALDPEI